MYDYYWKQRKRKIVIQILDNVMFLKTCLASKESGSKISVGKVKILETRKEKKKKIVFQI